MEGRRIVWGGIIVKVIDDIYDVGNGKIRLFRKFIKVWSYDVDGYLLEDMEEKDI